MAGQVISKITAGDGSINLITNSTLLYAETAANTAAKIARFNTSEVTGFVPVNGTTIKVLFTNTNTVANPTLTIQNTGETATLFAAKPIYKYGSTPPGGNGNLSWVAGSVVSLTYDNIRYNSNGCWIMNDHLDDSNTTYTAATSTTAVGTAAVTGTSTAYARADHVHNLTKATVTSALGYTPPTSDTNTWRPITTTPAATTGGTKLVISI